MVREALFSMLMADVPGARFLDLFAGTGSVGIEAMSRGASEVYWIEGDRGVAKTTLRNVSEIVGSDAEFRVVCSDVMRWIRSVGRNMAFDIVFADPPYADAKQDGCDGGLVALADALAKGDVIARDGLLITEMPIAASVLSLEGWRLLRDRTYGKTRLVVRQWLGVEKEEE
jgi:16S rRNA (guanine966-N2)-methyltransferase